MGLALDVLSQRVPADLVPDVAALQADHVSQVLINRIQAARNYCATVDPDKANVAEVLKDVTDLLAIPAQ